MTIYVDQGPGQITHRAQARKVGYVRVLKYDDQ